MGRFVKSICLASVALAASVAAAQTTSVPFAPGVSSSISGCEAEDAALQAARLRVRDECMATMRSRLAGVTDPREAIEIGRECGQQQLAPLESADANCRVSHLPGLLGTKTPAFSAGQAAEKAGNYQEAAQQFKLIDEDGNAIMAEAIARQQSNNSIERINADSMLDRLTYATTKLGIYEETGGDDPGAAQLYQSAIDRMKEVNGVAQVAMLRFAFMYANHRGVPLDEAKARTIRPEAAKLGGR